MRLFKLLALNKTFVEIENTFCSHIERDFLRLIFNLLQTGLETSRFLRNVLKINYQNT